MAKEDIRFLNPVQLSLKELIEIFFSYDEAMIKYALQQEIKQQGLSFLFPNYLGDPRVLAEKHISTELSFFKQGIERISKNVRARIAQGESSGDIGLDVCFLILGERKANVIEALNQAHQSMITSFGKGDPRIAVITYTQHRQPRAIWHGNMTEPNFTIGQETITDSYGNHPPRDRYWLKLPTQAHTQIMLPENRVSHPKGSIALEHRLLKDMVPPDTDIASLVSNLEVFSKPTLLLFGDEIDHFGQQLPHLQPYLPQTLFT